MKRSNFLARSAGISVLLLLASPAYAEGKADRARAAIAEATGKIDAANKLGANGEVPRLQAEAQAALRTARENLASGHKEEAIAAANHASTTADLAIGEAQKNRTNAERAQRANTEAKAAVAQQDAAAANARADAAQQSAASAAADAAAARAAPPVVIAPAPPTTTVSTETVKRVATPTRTVKRAPVHRVVKRTTTAPAVSEKTTTTVTTTPN
ncbi:hypothetical protein D3Y57_01270 (plasmid) [Sphingomonas paeninsulae]|uniref:MASP n=1 Tax=Sphingomonas paeninsulae TaxID=2319844 RepID=A0A494TBG8_SPHPE|nr:hypothetical protein [Sphingomonas paeninsulae]AYJ84762.1 hypothetical protein D3Y57_01270 [Sphingomonas paeninsulae]